MTVADWMSKSIKGILMKTHKVQKTQQHQQKQQQNLLLSSKQFKMLQISVQIYYSKAFIKQTLLI